MSIFCHTHANLRLVKEKSLIFSYLALFVQLRGLVVHFLSPVLRNM